MSKKKTSKLSLKEAEKELKVKKVKARVVVLKAIPYREIMVYLRRIDMDIFEYIIPFKGEIYSSYLIIKPSKGKKEMSKDEVNQAAALVLQSAVTTIDFLTGKTKKDKGTKELVKSFEGSRKALTN